ncbi:hypothetical protein PLESTM_001262000 [Pleodorina starrii]|nr:hypothetical protein PLESTM_001262000 [Pleodorina starrii]
MTMKAPARNDWTTTLFDCCAQPSGLGFCFYALCCPSCAYGSNVELMEPVRLWARLGSIVLDMVAFPKLLLGRPADQHVMCCGGHCCGACCAYTCMACLGCPCMLQMMARGYIRNKYGIPGGGCGDFLVTWCCTPCALCQERRELLIRGHGKGGVVQGAQEPPQQQQMLMVPLSVPVSVSVPVPVAVSVPVPGYPVVQPSDDLAPKPSDSAPKPSDAAPEPDGQQKSVKGDLPSLPTEADEQGSRPSLPTEADEQGKAV